MADADDQQSDIRDILQYIQQEGKVGLTHRGRMEGMHAPFCSTTRPDLDSCNLTIPQSQREHAQGLCARSGVKVPGLLSSEAEAET